MSLLRQWSLLLALGILGAGVTALIFPRPALLQVEEITVTKAVTLKNVLWIDARSEAEYSRGRIFDAYHLNEDNWSQAITGILSAWEPGQPVVVYCGSADCLASQAVAARLRGAEYHLDNVRVLRGGWDAWQEHAVKTVSEKKEPSP